jgi:hypothetical protein
METRDFPPEDLVRAAVEEELPEGVKLKRVSFTFGVLAKGMPESFMVVIELAEDEDARRRGTPGLGYAITERIRRRWSRGDLYVRIASSSEQT